MLSKSMAFAMRRHAEVVGLVSRQVCWRKEAWEQQLELDAVSQTVNTWGGNEHNCVSFYVCINAARSLSA